MKNFFLVGGVISVLFIQSVVQGAPGLSDKERYNDSYHTRRKSVELVGKIEHSLFINNQQKLRPTILTHINNYLGSNNTLSEKERKILTNIQDILDENNGIISYEPSKEFAIHHFPNQYFDKAGWIHLTGFVEIEKRLDPRACAGESSCYTDEDDYYNTLMFRSVDDDNSTSSSICLGVANGEVFDKEFIFGKSIYSHGYTNGQVKHNTVSTLLQSNEKNILSLKALYLGVFDEGPAGGICSDGIIGTQINKENPYVVKEL